MKCQRCNKPLSGKQVRWCSPRCSKLGLKAAYKKRNKKTVNKYNRYYKVGKHIERFKNKECKRCGTSKDLTINHIIPRCVGGKDTFDNYEILCRSCNTSAYNSIVKEALKYYYKHNSPATSKNTTGE